MSEKPVAWMTPGGDVSRSLEWCKERCWPEGEQPTPLYSQSPAEARALTIAECARVCERMTEKWARRHSHGAMGQMCGLGEGTASDCVEAIRALSSPPSVSEEWVADIIFESLGEPEIVEATRYQEIKKAIRATLAALGVTVEGAAK